jgi:hypothetical protein
MEKHFKPQLLPQFQTIPITTKIWLILLIIIEVEVEVSYNSIIYKIQL